MESVWVFHGINSRFTSGVFSNVEKAEEWIFAQKLTGVLTEYPLNQSAYDWALSIGYEFKKKEHKTPEYIGKFSSASQNHIHYEEGKRDS